MLRNPVLAVLLAFLLLDALEFASSDPSWTSLRVTYGANVFSSRTFAKLPRREAKARRDDYTKLPGECSEGKFLGLRFIKGNDPTAIVIYDVNGWIAGLQHGIPKGDVDRVGTTYSYLRSSAYQLDVINDDDVYLLTAYFVDPAIICNGGRTEDDYEEDGTGTGLYFQNGTDPIRDSLHVPLYEEGTNNVTNWEQGACKLAIGAHYWYEYSSMNCNQFFPFSIVYNRGKITGFAFFNFGKYEFSERFEHPAESALTDYMAEPIPQCIKDEYGLSEGFSMMHVFFSVRPWNIIC